MREWGAASEAIRPVLSASGGASFGLPIYLTVDGELALGLEVGAINTRVIRWGFGVFAGASVASAGFSFIPAVKLGIESWIKIPS